MQLPYTISHMRSTASQNARQEADLLTGQPVSDASVAAAPLVAAACNKNPVTSDDDAEH